MEYIRWFPHGQWTKVDDGAPQTAGLWMALREGAVMGVGRMALEQEAFGETPDEHIDVLEVLLHEVNGI